MALRIDARRAAWWRLNIAALETLPVPRAGHERARGVQRAPAGRSGWRRRSRPSSAESFEVRLFADGPAHLPRGRGALRRGRAPARRCVFLADASEAVAYQELRSQFVANVSHELRTPLTGLRGLLEALERPRAWTPATRGATSWRRAVERDPAAGGADLGHPVPVRARGHPGRCRRHDRSDLSAGRASPRSRPGRLAAEHGVRARGGRAGPGLDARSPSGWRTPWCAT